METSAVLDTLLGAGVVVETDDGIDLNPEFRSTVDELVHSLQEDRGQDAQTVIIERVDDSEHGDVLANLAGDDPEFVACNLTLHEMTEDLSWEASLGTTVLLQQLLGDPPRDEGSPQAFLPVTGDQLPTVLDIYRRAVVYAWQEDCDPCDLVRESFDELFEEAPGDIALLSVYGPDCAELLQDRFDVEVSPTTLFVVDGKVDARLVGAHYTNVYETEVETLRNR